jgi:3-hydroxyisobutyrate dehydrogenase
MSNEKGCSMRVTVLGLGRMGTAIAGRLLDGGHEVTVWNRSAGRAGDLVGRGAREAADILDAAAEAEVALTMLANDDAVRAVTLDGGLLAILPAEGVYVDSSTVSPALATELAAAAGADRFAAVPVLGSPSTVAAGQATLLAGGTSAVLDRIAPVLTSISGQVRTYPEPSLALAGKVTSNLVLLSGLAVLAEAFAVGRAGGLTDDQLRALLGESPVVAPGLRNRFEAILTGEREPWWASALGAKDAGLAVAVAEAAGTDVPVAAQVRDRYAATAALAVDADDVAAIGELYRR